MNNFENMNKTAGFSEQNNNVGDYEPFDRIRAENARFLEKLKTEAAQKGKEPFDAEKLLELYYPNDTSDDEEKILGRVKNLEMDYYLSDAMTIPEFAGVREEYDETKDSTGHDD